MTDPAWTPTPWKQGQPGGSQVTVYAMRGDWRAAIASTFSDTVDPDESLANAARIVACVNAMADVPDPAALVAERYELERKVAHYEAALCLEGAPLRMHPGGETTKEISPTRIGDLVAERDRLRAALEKATTEVKFCAHTLGSMGGSGPAHANRLRALLAELEELT